MEESWKKVSVKHGGKTCFYADPTLRRTFRESQKIFVGILSVEFDGVCGRKWNAEKVIVFKSIILQ